MIKPRLQETTNKQNLLAFAQLENFIASFEVHSHVGKYCWAKLVHSYIAHTISIFFLPCLCLSPNVVRPAPKQLL